MRIDLGLQTVALITEKKASGWSPTSNNDDDDDDDEENDDDDDDDEYNDDSTMFAIPNIEWLLHDLLTSVLIDFER